MNKLSQKDLMQRWECDSIRTVQRHRKKYGLEPVAFRGNAPLFSLQDVEALEEARREDGLRRLTRQRKFGKSHIGGILTLRQLKARARAKGLKAA